MSTIMFADGLMLFRNGLIAMDPACCCDVSVSCGCDTLPDEVPPCNPASLLPDLNYEIYNTDGKCSSIDTQGTMVRCGFGPTIYEAWWKANVSFCGLEGDMILYCTRNTAYATPGCWDYKLDFGATVSGCQTSPTSDQWSTSCSCGDASVPLDAWWRWEDIYSVQSDAPACPCANPPYNCTLPAKFDIYIYGTPP